MSCYYGSSGDVRELLGNPGEAEISATLLTLGRKKATAIVDSALEKVYPSNVPFAATGDVPAIINLITDDLAVYYITRTKHPGPAPLSDDVKAEYWDKPIDLLKKIQNREIDLPELTVTLGAQVDANRKDYTPIFDLDEIESAVVDSDLEDKIEDSRD